MGQLSSRLGVNANDTANTDNNSDNNSHYSPSNYINSHGTTANHHANSSTPSLTNLRRRRSSTHTNGTTQPPARRRRLRFWNRSDRGLSGATDEYDYNINNNSNLYSLPQEFSSNTINEINQHVPSSSSNSSTNPIQEAIEGSSGSGNITNQNNNINTSTSDRYIDELEGITSDLFSAVSRENSSRAHHYSSVSSLRSSSSHSSASSSSSTSSASNNHTHTHSHNHLHIHNRLRETARNHLHTNPNNRNPHDDIDSGLTFDHQTEMLSRLLEIAATSTIYSLIGASVPNGRRFDNISRTTALQNVESNPRALGNDTTFQEFVTGLRNGLLSRELSRNLADSRTGSESMTFFRAFRFDDNSSSSSTTSSNDTTPSDQTMNTSISFLSSGATSVEASSTVQPNTSSNSTSSSASENPQDSEEPQRMVPIVIVGVRSVQQGNDNPIENPTDDLNLHVSSEDRPANLTRTRSTTSRSDSISSSLLSEDVGTNSNTHETSQSSQTNEESQSSSQSQSQSQNQSQSSFNMNQQRSWVIFVLGNTFALDHPVLSAPSLMSENPTYEDLMHLQEIIGDVKPPVTTKEELFKHDDQLFEVKVNKKLDVEQDEEVEAQEQQEQQQPLFDGFKMKSNHKLFTNISTTDRCHICLSEYEDNEIIRKLGTCNHFYHKECIDTWLLNGKNNCPLCRSKGIVNGNEKESDHEVSVN